MATLASFRNVHEGVTIVVCGCGESLNLLGRPERFVTIGVNDVGRRFTPDYLVVVNPRSQFSAGRFKYVETSKSKALFTQFPDLGVAHPCVVNFRLGNYGGVDFSDQDVLHYTQNSPYVALCLAAHMGASRIGLIGVDFTENHFFGPTGTHPLTSQLSTIDEQYRRLGEALHARGVELVNLSSGSRLTAFPKITVQEFIASIPMTNSSKDGPLKIVSYATTPIAGVPLALARCINERTVHQAHCVWATNDYGNGVRFENAIEWTRMPEEAELRLREADLVIVHNGKMEKRHAPLLEGKAIITMAHNYMWNVDRGFVEKGWPGLVVGQYQATLAEFAGWQVVPNPVPFWETAYSPDRKPDITTICYTPSGTHERYPPDHRLYWHSKGYETTMRVLDRLAQRFKISVETVRGAQVSHAESLAMKRRSHIVIDECVTGSYHRNSLEGLSCGCVVVNGVGILPGVADVLRSCALGAETSPFVYADLEGLERVLVDLISMSPEVLAARGRQNRQWLEKHWDFAHQWPSLWRPALERATVAGSAPGSLVPVQDDASAPDSSRSGATRNFRIGVSVVIPHGGSNRLPHLGASLANLGQIAGVSEIIVVEMGAKPCADRLARRWGAKYVFIHNPDAFERARALNIGAALAEYDLVLWKDNDLLSPEAFVETAAAELRHRNLDHLLPYQEIRYLSAPDSLGVIAGACDPTSCEPAKILCGGRDVSGGAALVKSDFIRRYGGIPEMFRGWGGEDNAWAHKAGLFGRTGVTQRPGQYLFHLHHPDSGALAGKPLNTNPYYAENVALLTQLQRVRSSEEYLRQFPDTGRRICPWDEARRIVALCEGSLDRETATIIAGLNAVYGIRCESLRVSDDSLIEAAANAAAIIVAGRLSLKLLMMPSLEALWRRMVVVVTENMSGWRANLPLLENAAAVVLPTVPDGVNRGWCVLSENSSDPITLAIAVTQPLSVVIADQGTTGASKNDKAPSAWTLPVWVYWEGACPEWIRLCRETIRSHGGDVRMIDREAFEGLWDSDRDINITSLHVAHRADFVRAFLLARHGGLWIDSDCIVMKPLGSVLAMLEDNDFVAHKDRQGFYPNGFIGARPGSVIAGEFYKCVCERLRGRKSLGWISLGGEPLTRVLRTTAVKWRELPCELIQPICWSRPEEFFTVASAAEHALKFDDGALCYMISNTEVQKFVARNPQRSLLHGGTFFRYLIGRALDKGDNFAPRTTTPSCLGIAHRARVLLETLCTLVPRRILEIGVGTGYQGLLIREEYRLRPLSYSEDVSKFQLWGIITSDVTDLGVRDGIYDRLIQATPVSASSLIDQEWDLVILDADRCEWPEEVASACLETALSQSCYVLVFGFDLCKGLDKARSKFTRSLISTVRVADSWGDEPQGYLLSQHDPQRIARQHRVEAIFEGVFRDNERRGDESVSGPGSCLAQTYEIRQRLPYLCNDLGIRRLLDAPCGDFHWMQHVKLGVESYLGLDIVTELITRNQRRYGRTGCQFIVGDIMEAPLPRTDMIFCRDCLPHFSFDDIIEILKNFRRSGSTYLLTTTFPNRVENRDISTGEWRPLNLERAPFGLPRPMRIVNEKCTEAGGIYHDKSLGLWRFSDLPAF